MNTDSKIEVKAIHQITPEEIQRLHGNKFSIDTARRRILKVRIEKKLKRKFITIDEYCEFYELPVNDVMKSICK
jgi:hypothetical protein